MTRQMERRPLRRLRMRVLVSDGRMGRRHRACRNYWESACQALACVLEGQGGRGECSGDLSADLGGGVLGSDVGGLALLLGPLQVLLRRPKVPEVRLQHAQLTVMCVLKLPMRYIFAVSSGAHAPWEPRSAH